MNHQKTIKGLTIALIVLIVAAVIAIFAFYGTYRSLRENPGAAFQTTEAYAARAELEEDDIQYDGNAHVETVSIGGKVYQRKPNVVTILLLGIDADGSAVKTSQGERSDMMMLCTVDMDADQMTLTSLPRDTRTIVHDVNTETGKITDKTWTTKLNHAYNRGGGQNKYGAESAMRATEDLIECGGRLNIPVSYYVSIDLAHLASLADVLGGVEVTLEQNVPGVGNKGETVTLRGETVRLYLQNRKQMDNGEMDRQKHEQEFIMAIARKIKELGAVESASRLFTQLQGVVKMNLNLDQVVSLAGVLDKIPLDNIRRISFTENYQMLHDDLLNQNLSFFVMDDAELQSTMLDLYYTQV